MRLIDSIIAAESRGRMMGILVVAAAAASSSREKNGIRLIIAESISKKG